MSGSSGSPHGGPLPFSATTQARFWLFDTPRLASLRQDVHRGAAEKLARLCAEARESSSAAATELSALAVEEEALLREYYLRQTQDVCREQNALDRRRFTDRVMLTATTYFQRFFLKHSAVEENPKHVMLVALFLAGKIEEEKIEMDDLITTYAPKLKAEALLALEVRLLQTMNFQLVVASPYRALVGFLQDVQAWSTSSGRDPESVVQVMQSLQKQAYDWVAAAVCGDAMFLFAPQQIALAALHKAAAGAQSQHVDVGAWIQERFTFLPDHGSDGVQRLMTQLAAVQQQMQDADARGQASKSESMRSRLEAIEEKRKAASKLVRAHNQAA